MARARSPNRDKAFEMWRESNGEMLLKEIAAELEVSDSQIRKWKNQDNWDDQLKGNVTNKSKGNVTNKKEPNRKLKQQRVVEELEDADLTEKQRLFCLYYIKSFNATMAAIKAGYSKDSAYQIGYENLRKPEIAAEIRRIKGSMQQEVFIDAMDVLNKYIKIAFADITDYVRFGQRREQVIGMYGPVFTGKGEDKVPLMQNVNYVDLKDHTELDGSIISEVTEGKDGVKIKLADKMKALEKLEKYFDLLPDQFKRKIEEKKLNIAKEKLELEKTKVLGDEEELEDDGFIEALDGKVSEVWDDAEED